ncbi:MAG: N-acetyl-alpha-D-glucosaminyl L-malate synthase BshA [Candidatus Hydrogenedentes bacterium]|nr:N-acetyl-alpha-D-glucosaminyl L-malate synthase BshA [Candidatus Hydrogenedentota bacterium]
MRIGITCHPTAGGSGVLATELGIALAKRGHTIHFVTSEPPFRLTGYQQNIFSHYVDSPSYPLFRTPPYSLALASKIADVAEEFDIDVWHVHYAIPNAAAALIARDMLPPERRFALVTTLHGTDITLVGSDPSFYRITRYAMERSCAVTAVSNWLKDETEREFELSKPVETIYNFIDFDRFQGKSDHRCHLVEGDEKIVMHISNFRPVKRVTDVVRAFKKMADQVNVRLIMVGEGPEKMAAVGVAKQLGIADHIRYIGNHESIENLIPCADLVFQPSEHESFGLVPLEAMACGVPVLATASGGITEVIEHGKSGYLTEVGDIEAMANYGIEILTDPAKARAMGQYGREIARTRFNQDTIVAQYEALYARMLDPLADCEPRSAPASARV